MQERQTGLPINGPVVKAQAEVLNHAINGPDSDFAASNGWLWRWQKRHGVKQLKVVGEKRSADKDGAAQFPAKLLTYIDENDLVEEQIYNADESGLFYRMLPNTTLAQQNEARKEEGFKLAKDRVTVLFCVNKTGTHKLKPLCIGKYASPRCFHHVNMNAMPLSYKNSGNTWMTSSLFQDWFESAFVPSVRRHLRERRLEEKALLLLDNCRAHPPANMLRSADGKFCVMFMPPNTTSIIQPRSRHHIFLQAPLPYRPGEGDCAVRYGRNSVLEKVLPERNVSCGWKSHKVTATTIHNCWMEGLAPAFPTHLDEPIDDEDSAEFAGFTDEEIREAEDKLQDHLEDDQTLASFVDRWGEIDNTCAVDEPLSDFRSDCS